MRIRERTRATSKALDVPRVEWQQAWQAAETSFPILAGVQVRPPARRLSVEDQATAQALF